uniref:B30.2/SPRY domain-containing protein n=1 Tax=Globodera rostochiensis TaxID=31243 RepID=A0A914H616_GLORO
MASSPSAMLAIVVRRTLQNQWDPDARHEDLTFIDDNPLIVQSTGEKKNSKHSSVKRCRSVRAKLAIPKEKSGIFYYEVEILEKGSESDGIYIGLATNETPLGQCVEEKEGTYGYANDGYFWGYEVEGCFHWDRRPYVYEKPEFGLNDIVGCGVELETGKIIYTLNGDRLETPNWLVDSAAILFPFVTLYAPGTKIEANFGTKEFKFDIAKAFRN